MRNRNTESTPTDKGWSGKNIDRPEFQRLLSDIRQGDIKKLVVYKLDRISRTLNDFSNLMVLFRQYNVEFDAMPVESRNAIAKQFIQKILLWDDKIEIVWKF